MKNDPNLFEAFQGAADRGTAEAASSPAEPQSARGPIAGPLLSSVEPRAVLVVVLLMVGAFFAGWSLRGPGDAVQAAGPGQPRQPADPGGSPRGGLEPALDPGREARPSGVQEAPISTGEQVSAPSGLYNPDNVYTVLAITYTALPHQEVRARETVDYLRSQGLPAFDPVQRGDNIEILVGAKPTRGELRDLELKLQSTRTAQGKLDFESAMRTKIDAHVDRN